MRENRNKKINNKSEISEQKITKQSDTSDNVLKNLIEPNCSYAITSINIDYDSADNEYSSSTDINEELDLGLSLKQSNSSDINTVDLSDINTVPIQKNVSEFESTANTRNIPIIDIQETSFQQQVLKQIKEMRADFQNFKNDFTIHVATTNATLNIIVDMLSKKSTISDDVQIEPEITIDFPLKSKENLEDMERNLCATPALKYNLISKLATFGGLDGPKSIRIISKYMFDDNMLCGFSWGGTSTKHNFIGFKETLDCIIRAVRQRHKEFSDFEAAKFYKDYIKFAKFRLPSANVTTPKTATRTTTTTTTAASTPITFSTTTPASTTANNN